MRFIDLKSKAEMLLITKPTILCVGNFDGVHVGHRQLVSAVFKKYSELKLQIPDLSTGAWFFNSGVYKNVDDIFSLDEKIDTFAELGLDYAIIADFDEMKSLEPDVFVQSILQKQCKCIHAICGENFRFGSKAKGDAAALTELMHNNATVVPLLSVTDTVISSTLIRAFLNNGDIEQANILLCSNYSIYEPVIHGKALGRTIGIPTINQNANSKKILLKNGIYVTRCLVDGVAYYGVTNVGIRPTVNDTDAKNIETYLINFDDDCYGKTVKIEFLKRIRDEIKFDSIDSLKLQIQNDIQFTLNFINMQN